VSEAIKNPATEESADNADHKVSQNAARTVAWHYCFREEPGNNADDDPSKYAHHILPLKTESDGLATGDKIDHQNHNCDHKQQMNEPAADMHQKTDEPQDE
jgi:hypothetical protein